MLLLYPEQIKIVQKSNLKATVLKSYFKGTHYLIEATLKTHVILINSNVSIKSNESIYLETINNHLLNS